MKRLSGLDAVTLYTETPNVHMHTLKIAVIDTSDFAGEFTFDLFRRTVHQRLPLLDPLRYQLVDIPLKFHHPMWLENVEVDLRYHVRRVRVPAPGGRRELERIIGAIASTPLDRSRPLWEFHFAEGLAGNRIAVICKMHHALADGAASTNLMARGIDAPTPIAATGTLQTCAQPSTGALLRTAGADHIHQLERLPRLISDTRAGVGRLRRRSQERGVPAESAHVERAPTFMNHVLSPVRTFATATLSLADVKQTSKRLGITINDVVLATSAGALRGLLLRYDGRADEPIIASVPVNNDPSPDRISGNALGAMLVSLPVQADDPLERIRLTSAATRIAKENYQLLGPGLLGRWSAYVPPFVAPSVFRWLSQRPIRQLPFDLTISNVPGPRERGRAAGAKISEFYSVGPLLPGSGINITVWSYVDQLNVAVLCDDRTVHDPHEITDAMIGEFTAIRAAVGIGGDPTPVASAMAYVSDAG